MSSPPGMGTALWWVLHAKGQRVECARRKRTSRRAFLFGVNFGNCARGHFNPVYIFYYVHDYIDDYVYAHNLNHFGYHNGLFALMMASRLWVVCLSEHFAHF